MEEKMMTTEEMELQNQCEEDVCVEEQEKEEGQKASETKGFWQDNRGVGVIEIVLILVILIGLILVFKDQISAIVNNAFTAISGDAGKIIG